jgi:hypothetical protein
MALMMDGDKEWKRESGCTEVSGNMMLCYREQSGQNGGRPVREYKTRHQGADHAFR